MSRGNKELCVVMGSALLTLASVSLLCCPTARAGSLGVVPSHARASVPHPTAPADTESDLDDDRAEHWAVPRIAREERVQTAALAVGLAGAGALSARRRGRLREQKRNG